MIKYILIVVIVIRELVFAQVNTSATLLKQVFDKKVHAGKNGMQLLYRTYCPKPELSDSLPILVFLHGSGERGNDNTQQLTHFDILYPDSTTFINYPAVFIIPQCPENSRWVEVNWDLETHVMPEYPAQPTSLLIDLLDSLTQQRAHKIYLIGLSMGGFGVWDLISRYPDKFAAAVPICGGGDEKQAPKLTKIPIWAFHGALDQVVFPYRSRNMINAILLAGGHPGYSEFPDVHHGSWIPAFKEPGLLKWLFSK
ncbi:MAG: dienelactone hydrolase family protein [Ignavibacteria bacterium]|nr:dienelactone hydrolase family protein [Ignavibacteria bacterium]